MIAKGAKKLSTQVAPASKVQISETDILDYCGLLEKIQERLDDVYRCVPEEHLPQPSPEVLQRFLTPAGKSTTPFSSAKAFSASPAKSPAMSSFLSNMLGGQDLFHEVQDKARTVLRLTKDKEEFVYREEQRLHSLEQDKLTSMKRIMEYERELAGFPDGHKRLHGDICRSQAAYSLIQGCLNGLFLDKNFMREVTEHVIKSEEVPTEDEGLEAEGNLVDDDIVQQTETVQVREESILQEERAELGSEQDYTPVLEKKHESPIDDDF